jgi:hypothetical protein
MLKKFPWRQRTKHRTPTTKNRKFVITFNELGTPVKYPDERIILISQNSSMHITYTLSTDKRLQTKNNRSLEDNIFIIKKTRFFGLQHKRTPS